MLKFLDPYLPLIYIGLLAAALGGVFWYGNHQYNKGYTVAKAEAAEAVAKERVTEFLRQGRANAEATSSALETITRLELSNVALQSTIKENADAAKADPTATRACVSPDGVRRLNAVR